MQMNLDLMLLPENLTPNTYRQLISLLNEKNSWKLVAESFGIFSADDIEVLSKEENPAQTLLSELGVRLCTIGILCEVLKENLLYNILTLFKEHEPLTIINQSVGSVDDNSQMVVRGHEYVLVAQAVGIPLPTYQWFHKGIELNGKNEEKLVIKSFHLEHEGEYFCLIQQGSYGFLTSTPITLSLAPESPVIIKQPPSREVCCWGSKVIISVKAKGHPQLHYQWYKGNQQLNGCNDSKIVIDCKQENQDGNYKCYIYNTAGEVWSRDCFLTVYTTPNVEPSAKVALLIANQSYENLNKLYAPENDVQTLSKLLQDLGFLAISLQNLNLVEMRNAIRKFVQLTPPNAFVVFYFSGHGFEIQDKFMLPVDTPGPEDYLQSNAVCERELLRDILSSNPKLFLQLMDMCLKPPSPLNKKIFQETTDLYEYQAKNNLIQGYSTTSYLAAYEKKTLHNGLYVEHLKRYLTREKDLPIVEILQKVAKDVGTACMNQKPFFGTNVTSDYRLTDPCNPDSEIKTNFKSLTLLPPNTVLKFKDANVESKVTFSSYMDVFLNTLEVRFTNLQDFKVTCEAVGEELSFELTREGEVLVIRIMNIQKLVTNKTLTLSLMKNKELVDCAIWDIGKPMIAVADLWWNTDSACQIIKDEES